MVFNGADDPVVKLKDLRYSATPVDDTFLPKTWPWVASEWNKRRFDIPKAKKTDIQRGEMGTRSLPLCTVYLSTRASGCWYFVLSVALAADKLIDGFLHFTAS
jgi:hypothetical protein